MNSFLPRERGLGYPSEGSWISRRTGSKPPENASRATVAGSASRSGVDPIMTADTTRFKRRVWLAQAVSGAVLLFGVVAVILYFDPSLLGVPPGQYPYYKGRFIWLGTGLLFVGLGIAWILVSRRRAKRALWVYRNVPAVPMLLTLEIDEDSDSTTYHALLRTARDCWPALAARIGVPIATVGAMAVGEADALAVWAERLDIDIVAHQPGADPGAVKDLIGKFEDVCGDVGRDGSEIRRSIQFLWDGKDKGEVTEQSARYFELGITEQIVYMRGEHPERSAAKIAEMLPELRSVEKVRR